MERLRSLSLLSLCLLATVCLLLTAARADALTLGYDRNYGTAYVNILRRASMEPMEMLGCTHKRLELFQDRRVDAIEVYDFEAERFQRGTSEPLYWYPHFTATVVFAVPENAPVPVTRWADLRQDVTIVLPDSSPAREIFFLLLAQRMGPDFDTAFHRLARMKEEGRLRFYPVHRGMRSIFAGGDVRDVYVVFDHEADRLIRRGARLTVVTPTDGTLSFTKGLLSRTPLTFSDALPEALAAAGYPPPADVLPARAVPPDFLLSLRAANARYHTEIRQRPLLTPSEPHERFIVLVLTLVVTVVWGMTFRQRVLHHGARRAVLLLIAMLLLWELDRMAKILTFTHDAAFERLLWYLYYVFRGGLSVALLWIAWASDEDVLERTMPPWLKAVFGINLFLAVLILCNDLHHQFFYFTWSTETMEWSEHLAWGAYAYWTLWFIEIFAALLLLLEKAKAQQVLQNAMMLPFALFFAFIVYSIAYQWIAWVQWAELTSVTALFFLLLIELCMRTGLMPSNRLHQKFFTHSRLAMQLTDAAGTPVFVSAARTRAPQRDIRTARMEVDGGALLWQEDLSLLHEQQRRLTLTRDTLLRARCVLREEHTIRKRLLRLMLRRQLSEELEAILAAKRPLLRAFREQLMATDDEAAVTLLIRRLNLLSSYLKKRCVLFLKGQEDGYIRADELSMAVSETCTYLRPLGLRVGVEWAQQESLPEADALALFDFFAEFLARAAQEETADVFCRFADGTLTFLLEPADWITPWTADWQEHHAVRVALADRGYALSLRVRPAPAETEEAAAAADDAAACAAGGSDAHAQGGEPHGAETEGSSWNG